METYSITILLRDHLTVAYELNKSKEIENIECFALVLLSAYSVVENLYV